MPFLSWLKGMWPAVRFIAVPLQLWVNIVNGAIHDLTRADLYEYVVDFLTYSSNQELVWKYADWVLQKSEEVCAS